MLMVPGSLILETRFDTADGTVAVIDFMPPRGNASDVVRLVRGISGRVKLRMELVIRCGFGADTPWVKKTEDGDGLLLRFYEWAGKPGEAEIAVPEAATAARIANLMEEASDPELPLHSGRVKVPYHPFEIISIRLSYPPSPARGE